MANLFGVLTLDDADRTYINTVGQRVVFDATQQLLAQFNAEIDAATSVFVEAVTEDFKLRYTLPGGGKLQRRGGSAQSGAVKAAGLWDVALPLEDFGAQVAGDQVTLAYMSVAKYETHLQTVFFQDDNTVRFEMLKALLNNTQRTFIDPINGSLLVEPLANGDTVVYPPVLGTESEATENHYLESGYAAASISDTNNPYVTIRDELEEHFGSALGGSNIVTFINNAQVAKTEALTDFDDVTDRFLQPGADTDRLYNLPGGLPGRIIGRTNGVWVSEWRWIPANYMVAISLDAPKPLMMRVDPADTGLGRGLQLVAEDEIYPFNQAHYRHRFGFGAGNRLNGVVFELGTGGTFSIPSGYS